MKLNPCKVCGGEIMIDKDAAHCSCCRDEYWWCCTTPGCENAQIGYCHKEKSAIIAANEANPEKEKKDNG